MELDYRLILFGLLSYLAGGIPSGYLIAKRLKGIDIREHGSGNPGAANVYRTVGPAAGWATMAFDALKGFLPVLLVEHYYPENLWAMITCGALAIIGHVWTVFLRLRGGKGVATSAGVFAALMPVPMLFGFSAFVIATALTKHISVGSMFGALLMPAAAFYFREPLPLSAMASVVAALILYKHIPNLKRLLGGKEIRFAGMNGSGKKGTQETRKSPRHVA